MQRTGREAGRLAKPKGEDFSSMELPGEMESGIKIGPAATHLAREIRATAPKWRPGPRAKLGRFGRSELAFAAGTVFHAQPFPSAESDQLSKTDN